MAGLGNLPIAAQGMTSVSAELTGGKTYLLECAQDHAPIELFEIEAADATEAAAAAAEISAGAHASISRGLPLFPSTRDSLNGRAYEQSMGLFLYARSGSRGSLLLFVEA